MAAVRVNGLSSGPIRYDYVTDTSSDWVDVPNDTKFFDKETGEVHYKNLSGNVVGVFESSVVKVADVSSLPLTGDVETLYVISNSTGIYEWSGSEYRRINKIIHVNTTPGQFVYCIDSTVIEENIVIKGISEIYAANDDAIRCTGTSYNTKTISFPDLEKLLWGVAFQAPVGEALESISFPELKIMGGFNSSYSGFSQGLTADALAFKNLTFPKLEEVWFKNNNEGWGFKLEAPDLEGLSFPSLKRFLCKFGNVTPPQQQYLNIGFANHGGMSMPFLENIDCEDGSDYGAYLSMGIGSGTGEFVFGNPTAPFTIDNCSNFSFFVSSANVSRIKFYCSSINMKPSPSPGNGNISIYADEFLEEMDFSKLTDVGGNSSAMYIYLNASSQSPMTSLNLESLTRCNRLQVDGGLYLNTLILTSDPNGINVDYMHLDDCSLDEASINSALIAADRGDVANGDFSALNPNFGINAAPTGLGLAAKASLLFKGWTVATN